MIIKKIILENYGLYGGINEFDLVPRSNKNEKRNIILIGGKNGVGKTTLLNALRLVLYGKSILGKRVSQADYEAFLRQQVHQNKNPILKNTFSRLSVEFEHVAMGQYKNYIVERSWSIEKGGLKEFLKIFSDEELKENVTDDYWKGFIEEIIPERLSQLFFFDGEKIKDIAHDTTDNIVLADAIKTLLGLDIVEKLKADLSIYKTREVKKSSLNSFKKQWDHIDTAIKKLEDEVATKNKDLRDVNGQINGNLGAIKEWEKKLQSEGGHFAILRESLKKEKNEINVKIVELEDRIKEKCIDIFPFSLCSTVNGLLKMQIKNEKELSRSYTVQKEMREFQSDVIATLKDEKSIDGSDKKAIEGIISDVIKARLVSSESRSKVEKVLNFSENLANDVSSVLDDAERESGPVVKKSCMELEKVYERLRMVTKELSKSPDESLIQPFFEELTLLNRRHGELQQKEAHLQEVKKTKEYALKKYQWDKNKLIEQQKVHDQIQDRLKMVKKIGTILDHYYKELKEAKIDQLNQSFCEGFNLLMRKQIIERIKINPETFDVTLFDGSGDAVSKEAFSSGERQLYAIAMLWSLAKTSGRPLPVIIDTPLGRLDSDHRKNLISNYYPMASHQVILLSTDTEIDQKLYNGLKPNISHCYELKYDSESKSTSPTEGYFWKEGLYA